VLDRNESPGNQLLVVILFILLYEETAEYLSCEMSFVWKQNEG